MTNTPQSIDLLIEARWIAPVDTDGLLKNHAVAVHQGRILDLLPSGEAHLRYRPAERVRLDDHLLIPGLINLHAHAAMNLMRGLADDLPLMDWLQHHIWPTEAEHVCAQFVRDGTRLACAEMLRGGITCFNDMYFFPDAAAEAAAELGMRAMLGITTLEFPTRYASDAEDYLTQGLATRERWLNHPLIGFCLAPHAPYTVSDTTFERIATLAGQLNLPIHCHIHETAQEITEALERDACLRSLCRNGGGIHAAGVWISRASERKLVAVVHHRGTGQRHQKTLCERLFCEHCRMHRIGCGGPTVASRAAVTLGGEAGDVVVAEHRRHHCA